MMLINKIRNLIKLGRKTESDGTNGSATVLGKTQPITILRPYGLHSNAPAETTVVLLSPEAHEESMRGIESSAGDEVAENEILIGIPAETTRIRFVDGGNISFVINGAEGGDFLAKFTELKNGFDQLKSDLNTFITTYNTHTHPSAPTGPVSPPSSTGSTSSATIDSAKIDEMEVPS